MKMNIETVKLNFLPNKKSYTFERVIKLPTANPVITIRYMLSEIPLDKP